MLVGSGLISRLTRSDRGDSLLSSPLPPAVLKEADSVSQPAQQVQTLWKRRNGEDSDPEPVYTPRPAAAPLPPTLPPLPPHRVRANVRVLLLLLLLLLLLKLLCVHHNLGRISLALACTC